MGWKAMTMLVAKRRVGRVLFAAAIGVAQPVSAQGTANQYEPYRFLIGSWTVEQSGAEQLGIARFQWGPNQSYIWYSMSLMAGGVDQPHFEGMLVWNGVRKNLDMLIVVDLAGGKVQEQGTVSVGADGTVVRDITAYYTDGVRTATGSAVGSEGGTARFRQTFTPAGPDRVLTSVTRETEAGWIPTFPGMDRLVMVRRPES